jgi:hypothetical protein
MTASVVTHQPVAHDDLIALAPSADVPIKPFSQDRDQNILILMRCSVIGESVEKYDSPFAFTR